jgi:L-lactate dehydrogenase complex protein LldG
MSALLTRINPAECGYLAMITGPSRTADIERVLTIGVHGPERLIIIAVDELGGEN